jgi:hypothetical protein
VPGLLDGLDLIRSRIVSILDETRARAPLRHAAE